MICLTPVPPASLPVSLMVTSLLFQPLAFALGEKVAVVLGARVSADGSSEKWKV